MSGRVRFRGGWTCVCVARSLPLVELEMIRRGIITRSIDIYQLGYRSDVSASAGTHSGGGCTDVAQYSPEALTVWRDYGWTTQHRTRAQGFAADHGHGFPYGCPHLSPAARYQASEWRAGRNGLRSRDRITGPNYHVITWQAALRKLHPAPVPPLSEREIDMATWRRFVRDTPQLIKPGGYQLVQFTNAGDVSFATGPVKIIGGYVNLRLDGLRPGRTAYLRLVQDDVANKSRTRRWTGMLTEFIGTPGLTSVTVPLVLNVGKSAAGLRRVRAILSTSEKGVSIVRAEVAYWKASI